MATPPATVDRAYEYVLDTYQQIDLHRADDLNRLLDYIEGFCTGYTYDKRERQIREIIEPILDRLAERMYYDIWTSIPPHERRFLNRLIFTAFIEELFYTRNWRDAIRNALARTGYSVTTALFMFRTLARHGYEWARYVVHVLEVWYRQGIRYWPRRYAPPREHEVALKAAETREEAYRRCVELCVASFVADYISRGEVVTPEKRREILHECETYCRWRVWS